MTTKREKGLEFQRWIKKWLEERDWIIHNQRNDIYGCDLIAKKSDRKTLWIQATLDSGISRKIDELQKFSWNLDVDDIQVWLKRKDGKIDIFAITKAWLVHDMEHELIGHIIRRKFYYAEGVIYEY